MLKCFHASSGTGAVPEVLLHSRGPLGEGGSSTPGDLQTPWGSTLSPVGAAEAQTPLQAGRARTESQ